MYRYSAAIFIPAFLVSSAVSYAAIEEAAIYSQISYTNIEQVGKYEFYAVADGLTYFGNNLISNNQNGDLVDIDNNTLTNNSSAYSADISALSDATLAVAWNSNQLKDPKIADYVMISEDGEDYQTYKFDDIFEIDSISLGLLELNKYRFTNGDKIYVSLPLLQDETNNKIINKAGWWVIGSLPKPGEKVIYSLSSKKLDKAVVSFGLSELEESQSYSDNNRRPNKDFTASKDIKLDDSKTGDFYFDNFIDDSNKALFYLVADSTGEEIPSISLSLETNESTSNYYTAYLRVRLPESISNSEAIITMESPGLYVPNSMSVPYGEVLSGPQTDEDNDDIFSYNRTNSKMQWKLNSGRNQLNNTDNVVFRFLVNEIGDFANARAKIEIPSLNLVEYSNGLPIAKNKINDVSLHSFYFETTPTSGNLEIVAYGDALFSEKTISINILVEPHISIMQEELVKNKCEAFSNRIECELTLSNGYGYKSITLLHHLDPKIYGVGSVESLNIESDPNSANNFSVIEILKK